MPKSFDDFKSQKENYSDFRDGNVSINPNVTLNEETAKEICTHNTLSPNKILIRSQKSSYFLHVDDWQSSYNVALF